VNFSALPRIEQSHQEEGDDGGREGSEDADDRDLRATAPADAETVRRERGAEGTAAAGALPRCVAMSNEPAARAGDAERAAAAPTEVAVSRQHRKLFAMTLAGLASVAIVAVVGVGGSREAGELLEGSGGASVRAVRHRDLLQKLLAKVERGGSSLDGFAGPVELEEKNAAKAVPAKPCDASCQLRKKEIASRMKALRDQINRDFKAMTSINALPSPHRTFPGYGGRKGVGTCPFTPSPGVFGR
jgi:hypothetical protein